MQIHATFHPLLLYEYQDHDQKDIKQLTKKRAQKDEIIKRGISTVNLCGPYM